MEIKYKITMTLDDIKNHFKEEGDNYAAGREMALSLKPLTIEDVRDAYNQAVEDIFTATNQGLKETENKEYYVLKEEDGFLRMLYRCKTVEGLFKHLPDGLTEENLIVLLNKGLGSIRYDYDEKTTYHFITIEQWDKIDEL